MGPCRYNPSMSQPAAVVVERVLADPPVVHERVHGKPGVWSTDADCYRFIAANCGPGSRTLEVGIGLSTVLFTALGCHHVCVTLLEVERDRIREHCGTRGIDDARLEIAVGRSDEVLPTIDPGPLDLVFIDGAHGFPAPLIDFHYGARWLRRGAVLVADDLGLPAPALLADFLDLSDQWETLRREPKWGAWRRLDRGPFAVRHFQQPFLDRPWLPPHISARDEAVHLLRRATAGVRLRLRGALGVSPEGCTRPPAAPITSRR